MADASDPWATWVAYTGPCARCRRHLGYAAWPLDVGPCCGACRAELEPAWVAAAPHATTQVCPDLPDEPALFDDP